jgi:hypothetical protein
MPKRCVVAGCSNEPDKEKDISLHAISFTEMNGQKRKKGERNGLTSLPQTSQMDANGEFCDMLGACQSRRFFPSIFLHSGRKFCKQQMTEKGRDWYVRISNHNSTK